MAWMKRLPHMHVLIALLRDGFHPDSFGGRVRLARDGTPLLDYVMTPYLFEGARRAMIAARGRICGMASAISSSVWLSWIG